MTLTLFLILGLATWRVSSLILYEDGPWRMFDRVRTRAGANTPGELSTLAVLFSCVMCMSVWVALAGVLLGRWEHGIWVLAVPAGSTVAIVVDRLLERLRE